MSLEDELYQQRISRIAEIEALGFQPYGHRFDFSHTIPQILADYGAKTTEELEPRVSVKVAGRISTIRRMGKAGFAHLFQNGERLQIYIRKDAVSEKDFALYEKLDLGDIIGVEGYLFRTRTGELSVHAERLYFLAKTLYSMPEKWHGLEDVEIRYRQRYLDLLSSPESRKVFVTRAKIVASMRRQLEAHGFLEVETPMLQPLYGGAAARPFRTHHNTLDIDLYLRIAPELYLKRLIVGGLERVYEINRNFRNEGISTRHNPEFTMLEFYQAYTDYLGMMDLSEELLRTCRDRCHWIGGSGIPGRENRFRQLPPRQHARCRRRSEPEGSCSSGSVRAQHRSHADPADHRFRLSGGSFAACRRTSRTIRILWSASRSTWPAWKSATRLPS